MQARSLIDIGHVSSGRIRIITAAVAIVTLSIVGSLLAIVPADSVTVPSGQIPMLPYDSYSAYAMSPANGYINHVQAAWTIPRDIVCPALGGGPRVAIRVGTWGDTSSINDGTAWLPQIGTDSECTAGLLRNSAVWQIPGPEGNKPQTISSVPVHPGDMIVASVTSVDATANPYGSVPRKFALVINDTTDNRLWEGFEWTGGGARMDTIVRQAGAVVEGSIPCPLTARVSFTCGAPQGSWVGYGLAKFRPLIDFSGIRVGADVAAPSWNYFEYVMRAGQNGPQLASNSLLFYHATGSTWSYAVAWGAP
jgi:hypothetical protein